MLKNFKIAGAVLGMALLPMSANALTLKITDTSMGGGTFSITDGDMNDLDGTVNGIISAVNLSVGTATISISTAQATDANGQSLLTMNVTNGVAGAGDLWIDVSHTGFGAGARSPGASGLTFAMNASDFSGGLLAGESFVDNGDNPVRHSS